MFGFIFKFRFCPSAHLVYYTYGVYSLTPRPRPLSVTSPTCAVQDFTDNLGAHSPGADKVGQDSSKEDGGPERDVRNGREETVLGGKTIYR